MPFTAQELANIANAAMDFFIKGPAIDQIAQDRPLYNALRAAQKTFPGGKNSIRGNVKGVRTTSFQGYSHDDTVSYANPANLRQYDYAWKEMHAGISLTMTELKADGITVVDSLNGEKTVAHDGREMTAITNLLEDKLDDMAQGSADSFNRTLWLDGSQDPKVFAGIASIVLPTATVAIGTTGGIDRATNAWWRNRALTGASKVTASATNQTLSKALRKEARQLKRYGGKPSLLLGGSGFLEKLEIEVAEKGVYTQAGFANNGKTDIGIADISMRGVGTFQYDPTLDDLGLTNFCYFLDPRHLVLRPMDGEDMKQHSPARPPEKYVLYRGVTWTGGLIADQLNCHGVYEAA
jgi:hypothetical protein